MKPSLPLLTCLLFITNSLFSQREADNWYFGWQAGINFSSGAPVALTGGQIQQSEGVASISDANGNLLFYTSGYTVWNRNHVVMPNGTGLYGQGNSAQSGVIVPMPGSRDIYYLFTVVDWYSGTASPGLSYSIVDMRLNNGLGDITSKNVLVNTNVREQVSSAFHANCKDIWIVTHEKANTNFMAYLLTASGLQMTPVVSSIGMAYTGGNRYGYLRFSASGERLCSTLGGSTSIGTIELYDFNKATGAVSNPVTLATANAVPTAYTSEFSRDTKKLYVTSYNDNFIYQYNLAAGSTAAIIASRVNIATGSDIKACVQMAPDKKIYVVKSGKHFLGAIDDPDKPGLLCNYVDDAVSLGAGSGSIGLPNFMQGFFSIPYLGVDTSICPDAPISVTLSAYTQPLETYTWQDGSSNATFAVNQPGEYWVEVNNTGCIRSDTFKVAVRPLPAVNLGIDRGICPTATVKLDAAVQGTGITYSWMDGAVSSNATYTATQAGDYWVKATENGCSKSDTITLSAMAAPILNLGNDKAICPDETATLDAYTAPGNTYLWQNGSSDSIIKVSTAGKYWVEVKNTGCSSSDTVFVTTKPFPVIDLGTDVVLCPNSNVPLDASTGNNSSTYVWHNGSTAATFSATQPGKYWVDITEDGCSSSDTVVVTALPVISLGSDTSGCDGKTVVLQTISIPNATYSWQDGSSLPSYTVTKAGTYKVNVTTTCGIISDEVVVQFSDCDCYVYFPNAFSPNANNQNDLFKPFFKSCRLASYNMKIFNRWGQVVFETTNPATGWNGYIKGRSADTGTYIYLVNWQSAAGGEKKAKHGTLSLVH